MSYARDGYAIYERAIDIARLDAVADVLHMALCRGDANLRAQSLPDLITLREREDHRIVYESALVVGSSFAAYELVATSTILDIVGACTGAARRDLHPMPLHVLIQNPDDEGYDYTWHQESTFYPWCPDILSLWFPIDAPSSTSAGTMMVVPQSHAHGVLPHEVYFNERGFRQMRTTTVDDEAGVAMEVSRGSAVAFDAHVVHRSLPNRSDRPRLSGVLRVVNMATQRSPRPLYKALPYSA